MLMVGSFGCEVMSRNVFRMDDIAYENMNGDVMEEGLEFRVDNAWHLERNPSIT